MYLDLIESRKNRKIHSNLSKKEQYSVQHIKTGSFMSFNNTSNPYRERADKKKKTNKQARHRYIYTAPRNETFAMLLTHYT